MHGVECNKVAISGRFMMRVVVDSADITAIVLIERYDFHPQSFALAVSSIGVFRGESKNNFYI